MRPSISFIPIDVQGASLKLTITEADPEGGEGDSSSCQILNSLIF